MEGPDGAPRDFELGGYGIEVKSSASKRTPDRSRTRREALDQGGLEALFLVHQSLEVLRDAGETLR